MSEAVEGYNAAEVLEAMDPSPSVPAVVEVSGYVRVMNGTECRETGAFVTDLDFEILNKVGNKVYKVTKIDGPRYKLEGLPDYMFPLRMLVPWNEEEDIKGEVSPTDFANLIGAPT